MGIEWAWRAGPPHALTTLYISSLAGSQQRERPPDVLVSATAPQFDQSGEALLYAAARTTVHLTHPGLRPRRPARLWELSPARNLSWGVLCTAGRAMLRARRHALWELGVAGAAVVQAYC